MCRTPQTRPQGRILGVRDEAEGEGTRRTPKHTLWVGSGVRDEGKGEGMPQTPKICPTMAYFGCWRRSGRGEDALITHTHSVGCVWVFETRGRGRKHV